MAKKPVKKPQSPSPKSKPAAKRAALMSRPAAPAKSRASRTATRTPARAPARKPVAAKSNARPMPPAKTSAPLRNAPKVAALKVSKPVVKVSAAKAPTKPQPLAVKPVPAAPPAAAAARVVAPVKPGVKNGDAAVARIAVKPQLVNGLAASKAVPVLKLVKAAKPRPEPIPVRLPPAPVRSDSKMARNRAGMTSRELEHFRDLLYAKKRELTGDVSSMETSALRSGNSNLSTLPMHMADAGTDNYEQEFTLGLVEKDRKLLRDINVALAKIQDGSYGICEGTGKPISKPRLEAQPWAKYSIEHARQLERPQYRRAF